MQNPNKENFGYQVETGFDSETGWMLEGGEDAYYEALDNWHNQNLFDAAAEMLAMLERVLDGKGILLNEELPELVAIIKKAKGE